MKKQLIAFLICIPFLFSSCILETYEGDLAVFSTNGDHGEIEVFINGESRGKLTTYFTNSNYTADCGESGTITATIDLGSSTSEAVSVRGLAEDGTEWEGAVTVYSEDCSTFQFR